MEGSDVNLSRLRSDVAFYVKQLLKYFDRARLQESCILPRRNERVYGYGEIIQEACCACFRSVSDGKKPIVYGYDGRLWKPLLGVVFENVIRDALIEGSGRSGTWALKSDWVDKQGRIMQFAYDGVIASPLVVNHSIVGFRNGVWDFSDIDHPVKVSYDERPPVTFSLDYDYDEDASCPLWLSFLNMMLAPSDITVLQKYMGLGCVNRRSIGRRVEDSLWLIGGGANGKSTIESVVRAVVGGENIGNASLSQLLDKQPDARMRAVLSIDGKVFNLCDEVDVSDMTKGSDAFKKLCSGEPQNVRGIGKDISVAYDIPFLIFSMNQMPSNKRMDDAFRRRIVQIDFNRTVHAEDMDPELLNKLLTELPGIRNWMIEGYRMLARDDFRFKHTSDESYMEANEQYFDIFCKELGLRSSAWAGRDEKAHKVLFAIIFDHFHEYCRKRMFDEPTPKKTGLDMKRLCFRGGRSGQGRWYYIYCDNPPKWFMS